MLKGFFTSSVTVLLIASALIGGPVSAYAQPQSAGREEIPVTEEKNTAASESEPVYAEEITQSLTYSIENTDAAPYWRSILDGSNMSHAVIPEDFVISALSDVPVGGVYIESDEPVGTMHVSFDGRTIDRTENTFLHFYIDGISADELMIWFDKSVSITDIHFFSEGEKPDYVQTWEPVLERPDVLLLPAHYDDELLYFGGVIPWCIERGASVMVAYFCSHEFEEHRKHEMLDGLWESGIRNYPIFGEYHDSGNVFLDDALWRLKYDGYEWEDLLERQVRIYRQFKPQVVLTHAEDGEYGHCQHILYELLAVEAAAVSGDADFFPDSAEKYGVYEVPKVYVHDYVSDHGQIVLDLDQPLETRNGMTSYEVTVAALKKHATQVDYFYSWLILPQRASEIRNYSPCRWGLYITNVGDDTSTDTFFDNIILLNDKERDAREAEEPEQNAPPSLPLPDGQYLLPA